MAPFGHTCVGLTLTELVLSVLFGVPNLLNCIFTTLRKDSPKVAQKLRKGVCPGGVSYRVLYTHVRQMLHHCSVSSVLLETHGVDCCHFRKAFTHLFFLVILRMEPGTSLIPHKHVTSELHPASSPVFLLRLCLTKLPGLTLNSPFV